MKPKTELEEKPVYHRLCKSCLSFIEKIKLNPEEWNQFLNCRCLENDRTN